MPRQDRARAGRCCAALLTLAVAAAATSLWLRPTPDAVTTWWPAAGLCIAALGVAPRRWWPALTLVIVAATATTNLVAGRSHEVAVALAGGNAVEALVGAAVLVGRRGRLRRLVDPTALGRLLVASSLGAAAAAVTAELAVRVTDGSIGRTPLQLLAAHLAGSLVVLFLVLVPWRPDTWHRRAREIAAQYVVALGVTAALVASDHPVLALAALVPTLAWGALRAGPDLVALQVALIATAATVTTAVDLGGGLAQLLRTVSDGPLQAGVNLQAFVVGYTVLAAATALATEQRRTLLHRLDAEHQLSSATLDMTAVMIVVTDEQGIVVRANDAVARLTGFEPDRLCGQPLWACPLIPVDRRDIVRAAFDAPHLGSIPTVRESDVMTHDGGRLRVVWNNNVVRDAQGAVTHVVSSATDITVERVPHQVVEHLFGSPKAAPMLLLDTGMRVTLYNAACEELFGLPAAEVVGGPVVRLVCPEQLADMEGALAMASEQSRRSRRAATLEHEWSWMRPEGDVVRLSATVSAVVDALGRQVGTLVVAADVTRQAAQDEALQGALESERRAVERLRRLDTVKNEFVSTVSHELRTPTTSIVGYTEMLRDEVVGTLDDEQRQLLDVIARNGRRLIAVADDLLLLAGLESAEGQGHTPVDVDLARVVHHARDAVSALLADRSVELRLTVSSGGPVVVRGDAAHLDRVVLNLLSNAVKFTPDDGRVWCSLTVDGEEAVVEVGDTGIGIPEAEQADLFSKFFRSSTAQELAIPGTGLGLSIVHRIVSDHGGQITFRSTPGEGTVFTVRLPVVTAAPVPDSSPATSRATAA